MEKAANSNIFILMKLSPEISQEKIPSEISQC